MLVITRKLGECIIFQDENGTTITLTVTKRPGEQMRFVIDAPPSVKVLRSELLDKEESK